MITRSVPVEARKIKIGQSGAKRKSGGGKEFRMPQKWDHIGICLPWKDDGVFVEDVEVMDAIEEERGTRKPRTITVLPPSDNPEDFFVTFKAYYASRQLACHSSDGITASRFEKVLDEDGNEVTTQVRVGNKWVAKPVREWKEMPCVPTCGFAIGGQCKQHTKVAFQLPYVNDLFGYAILRTTSIRTKQNLEHTLFKALPDATNGFLRGIPLDLRMYTTEFGKHRVKVLRLTWPDTLSALQTLVRQRSVNDVNMPQRIFGEFASVNLDPMSETPDEQAEVADEFHHGEELDGLSELERREQDYGYSDENLMEEQEQGNPLDEPCVETKEEK